MNDLLDAERLQKYDVVFLTCGARRGMARQKRTGRAQRDSAACFACGRRSKISSARPSAASSMWAARSTPPIGIRPGGPGLSQFVDLANYPAPSRPSMPRWSTRVAKAAGQDHRLELRPAGLAAGGLPPGQCDHLYPRPLSHGVRRPADRGPAGAIPLRAGNVIFTSFHNETQNSGTERELLRYLVFSAVRRG